MLNKVILSGRLTNDIELKQTNDGIQFAYFTLAVNRRNRNASNQKQQADFIDCVVWRAQAETMSNFLNKGSLIAIEGRMEVFTSQNDGQYNKRVNVNVEQFHFLETKKDQTVQMNEFNNKIKDDNVNSNSKNNISFSSESNLKDDNEDLDEFNFDDIKF